MNNLESLLKFGRVSSSTRTGSQFDFYTIQSTWDKGFTVFGGHRVTDPARWRFDACGALIERAKYGDTDSDMGWEIDHVTPVSKGGIDDLWNLQPLHWKNNRKKGDGIFLNAAAYCEVQYSSR
jgi:hypothetical protein